MPTTAPVIDHTAPPAGVRDADVLRPLAAADADRVGLVDALRGVALLVILLANVQFYAWPVLDIHPAARWTSPADRAAEAFTIVAATGKGYSLFALLFGFGAGVQFVRTRQRGARFGPFFGRRLLLLMLIGFTHITLFWAGDILVLYAVLGFALPVLLLRSDRTLLTLATLLWLGVPLLFAAVGLLMHAARADQVAAARFDAQAAESKRAVAEAAARAATVYAEGDFAATARQRWSDYRAGGIPILLGMGPSMLSLFLVGIVVQRRGWLRDPGANQVAWRRVAWISVPAGLALNGAAAALMPPSMASAPPGAVIVVAILAALGGPLLGIGYVAAAALAWTRPALRHALFTFAPVGRLALTNYLLQSLLCSLTFNGYGLGWYGQAGTLATLLLAFGVYALQVALSRTWAAAFRYGPVEWLWRMGTYGRYVRLLRAPGESATASDA